ncbi:MAG: TM0996/MTH895 family glutaredoxin-like protein [Flavobacteriales bacterium]|nr:TM0996/MTH895 family glutaredoxin-like protein [Flavobacteriales bacterium]
MNLKIKILGTGCKKCTILTDLVQEVTSENNLTADIEKVENIEKIMEYNVFSTPTLIINEKIAVQGRIPSKKELLEIIQKHI